MDRLNWSCRETQCLTCDGRPGTAAEADAQSASIYSPRNINLSDLVLD
jgi:hypothetical protein